MLGPSEGVMGNRKQLLAAGRPPRHRCPRPPRAMASFQGGRREEARTGQAGAPCRVRDVPADTQLRAGRSQPPECCRGLEWSCHCLLGAPIGDGALRRHSWSVALPAGSKHKGRVDTPASCSWRERHACFTPQQTPDAAPGLLSSEGARAGYVNRWRSSGGEEARIATCSIVPPRV